MVQCEWEHSSVGRASDLQAEGHRFEPCCSHHSSMTKCCNGLVAQLVRAPPCHGGGRGFEPHPGRHYFHSLYASVAQLVEQGTENPRVVGSIPTGGTSDIKSLSADLAHLVERDLAKVEVAGSSPVIRSKKVNGHPRVSVYFIQRANFTLLHRMILWHDRVRFCGSHLNSQFHTAP